MELDLLISTETDKCKYVLCLTRIFKGKLVNTVPRDDLGLFH